MAMACTPRSRSVHWGENELNEYSQGKSQSPYSDAASVSTSSESSTNATSTLAYINSQLVAHGFARSPGVSFEGLSKQDSERLAKCVLGMLSQRVEDMARAEDLSTKLRTLSYEHERLSSMHRTTLEQLASSERETSLFKSRLATAQKALQASENAHKATSSELQRTRSSLLSVRQTYAAELKRREKETEKLLERWQKISDAQTKLGAIAAGLKFKSSTPTNSFISGGTSDSNASSSSERGNGNAGLLEDALEEAEMTRRELMHENASLKSVVLSAANELVRTAHSARVRSGIAGVGSDPPCLTLSDIFSISAPESAHEKFSMLLDSFREAVSRLKSGEVSTILLTTMDNPSSSAGQNAKKADGERAEGYYSKEIQRLQSTIVDLRRQLEQAQVHKQSGAYADQAQAIIRRFVNEDDDKVSVKEREVIEKVRKDLDNARRKVDEAALALKDEKQALEEKRQAFLQEQHLWRSQMCIPQDPLQAPPPTGLAAYFGEPTEPLELPYSPPRAHPTTHRDKQNKKAKMSPMRRVSPKKSAIGGVASPRRAGPGAAGAGVARKSPAKATATTVGKSAKKAVHGHSPKKMKAKPNPALLGASPTRQKVIPPMETEVIVHPLELDEGALWDDGNNRVDASGVMPAATTTTTMVANATANATSFMIPSTSQSLIISNSFVLPPPTPMTSLPPPQEDLLSTLKKDKKASRAATTTTTTTTGKTTTGAGKPKTPFPVAKPLAQHMIHAYSPARPSPLSRILMLSQSPAGGAGFGAAAGVGMGELSYDVGGDGEWTTTPSKGPDSGEDGYGCGYENENDIGEDGERTIRRPTRVLTLEEELGITDGEEGGAGGTGGGTGGVFEDDEESEMESSVDDSPLRAKDLRRTASGKTNANARGALRSLFGSDGTGAGPATGKGALFDTKTTTKAKDGTKEKEKENGVRTGAGAGGMNPGVRFGVGAGPRAQPAPAPSGVKPLAGGKGGARRVPIGSADAAPIGPGWK